MPFVHKINEQVVIVTMESWKLYMHSLKQSYDISSHFVLFFTVE